MLENSQKLVVDTSYAENQGNCPSVSIGLTDTFTYVLMKK